MRQYKYNINTFLSTVSVEIYYKSTKYAGLEISVCSKDFPGGFFRNYPKEEQLINAKNWAIAQCEILNKHQ